MDICKGFQIKYICFNKNTYHLNAHDSTIFYECRFDLTLSEYRQLTYERAVALFRHPLVKKQFDELVRDILF